MIPTMLVVGLLLGLVPRWWPHSLPMAAALAVLGSLAFGFLIGEPLAASALALALANTVIGLGLGRALQLVVPAPGPRHRAA